AGHLLRDQACDLQLSLREPRLEAWCRLRRRGHRGRQSVLCGEGNCVPDGHGEATLIRLAVRPRPKAITSNGNRPLVLLSLCVRNREAAGLPHVLAGAQEDGGTLMHATLGCHPGEGLEQELESGPIVDGMLGRGARSRLDFGELPIPLSAVNLRGGTQHVAAGPQFASLLADPDTLIHEVYRTV